MLETASTWANSKFEYVKTLKNLSSSKLVQNLVLCTIFGLGATVFCSRPAIFQGNIRKVRWGPLLWASGFAFGQTLSDVRYAEYLRRNKTHFEPQEFRDLQALQKLKDNFIFDFFEDVETPENQIKNDGDEVKFGRNKYK